MCSRKPNKWIQLEIAILCELLYNNRGKGFKGKGWTRKRWFGVWQQLGCPGL